MARIRYGALTLIAAFVCATAVVVVPQVVSAMAGRRTVVEFNTFFTITFAASFVVNIALAVTLVSTLATSKRARQKNTALEARLQIQGQGN